MLWKEWLYQRKYKCKFDENSICRQYGDGGCNKTKWSSMGELTYEFHIGCLM